MREAVELYGGCSWGVDTEILKAGNAVWVGGVRNVSCDVTAYIGLGERTRNVVQDSGSQLSKGSPGGKGDTVWAGGRVWGSF